ncbi:MAG: CDP-alcohol phosphatidyltransferase family protein [Fibrobacteria bacterium]|nr:CDP-alcohol phosphatidyltransferase family protein [Fibrobacteria bacterium]
MGRTKYAIPNFFTSLNFLMGTFAVVLAPLGSSKLLMPLFGGHERTALEWSAWLIVYSVLLDKLDGFFAKRLNASSAFGAEFDSLADLVAFGLAPAMLLFHGIRQLPGGWAQEHLLVQLVVLAAYVLCSAWRLARYNVAQADLKGWFVGMPTTLSGGWIALVWLLVWKYQAHLDLQSLPWILYGFHFLLAALMISPFYISKLVSRTSKFFNYFQIANILLGYACGLAMMWPEVMFAQMAIYTAVGFTWGVIRRKKIASGLSAALES